MKTKIIHFLIAICFFAGISDSLKAQNTTCATAATINISNNILLTHYGSNISNWYKFIPGEAAIYEIKYNGNAYIYTGTCNNLLKISESLYEPDSIFYAEAGKTYYIKLESKGLNQIWELNRRPENPEGKYCQTAQVIDLSDDFIATAGINWYSFTIGQDGVYTIKNEDGNMWGALYTGICDSLSPLNNSSCNFYAQAGITYYVQWENRSTTRQLWKLKKIENTEGLICQTAKAINVSTNIIAGKGVTWYGFTPAQEGVYEIKYHNPDDRYYGGYYVYTGDCDNLKEVGTRFYAEFYAEVGTRFYAEVGTTYYISWSNRSDTNQTFELNTVTEGIDGQFCETAKVVDLSNGSEVTLSGAAIYSFTPLETGTYKIKFPFNDKVQNTVSVGPCNNRKTIAYTYDSAAFYAEVGNTYYISPRLQTFVGILCKQEKEEGLACQTAKEITLSSRFVSNENENWYYFTPEQDGNYLIRDTGSNVNSYQLPGRINIYTGICNNLADIAKSDYTCSSTPMPFYAKAGTTYYLKLGSSYCDYSNSNLNKIWKLTIENERKLGCETATIISSSNSIPANNKKAANWYSFTPSQSGGYQIKINNMDMSGALYSGPCSNNLKNLMNITDSASFYAEAGTTYYIYWWNYTNINQTWELNKLSKAPVTGIHLTQKALELNNINSTFQLAASVFPINATNQKCTWKSTNTNIATVSNNGLVNAIANGTTYVIVTSEDGGFKDSCLVTVTSQTKEPEITVVPQANAILITWPKENNASNYTLILFSDAARTQVIGVYEFDSEGRLLTKEATYSHTITGLTAETHYYYSLTAYDEDKQEIKTTKSDFTTLKTTGIEEAETEEAKFVVYPNPTYSGQLTIETSPQTPKGGINDGIQLYDLVGKLVGTFAITGEKTEINISHLPSGTYFVKVGNAVRKVTKR